MSRRLRHPLILRGLLAEKNLSYQEFANRIGCHKGTVAKLCTGRQETVSDELADRVITVLELPAAQLFADTTSPTGRQVDQTAA